MKSKSNRYIIAFAVGYKLWGKKKDDNIKNVNWEGTSDTEVLLKALNVRDQRNS